MPDPPPGFLGGEKTTRCISKAKENTKMQFGEIIRDILEMHHILHAINFSSNLIWGWRRGWDERGRGSRICIKERCAMASLNPEDGGGVLCCCSSTFLFPIPSVHVAAEYSDLYFPSCLSPLRRSVAGYVHICSSLWGFLCFFKSISAWPLRIQGCVMLNLIQTKRDHCYYLENPFQRLKGIC